MPSPIFVRILADQLKSRRFTIGDLRSRYSYMSVADLDRALTMAIRVLQEEERVEAKVDSRRRALRGGF